MNPENDVEEPDEPVAGGRLRINGNAVPVNGAVRHDDDEPVAAAVTAPVAGLEDVAWRPSYDRESVDRYLAEVEAEKARLLAEIRLAEEREAAARERTDLARSSERDAILGALLLAAREEVDRVDTEHRETVSAIRALAQEEATSIRDRAEADSTAVRDAVASLAAITSAGESMRDAVASLTSITSADEATQGALTESTDDVTGDLGDQNDVG